MATDQTETVERRGVAVCAEEALRLEHSSHPVGPSLQRLARLLEPDIETGPGRAALKAGDVLAERYIVERLAGEGGMGAVYRGTDRLVGVAVAIKVMGRAVSASGDRFRDEVRFLSRLQHPAIVRYIAHGAATDGAAFLVMEWLEGEDLAQHLAKKKLDLGKSLLLACRAAEGLAVAHAEGIIHRDIKPSNLFLVGGDPGQLKVLDFGTGASARHSQRRRARRRVLPGMRSFRMSYGTPRIRE